MKKIKHDAALFDASEEGKSANKRFNKIKIDGILCIAAGLIYFVYILFSKGYWYDYFAILSLLLFGIYFIYKAYDLKIEAVNRYIYGHLRK